MDQADCILLAACSSLNYGSVIVKALLEDGANVNCVSKQSDGPSVLVIAVGYRNMPAGARNGRQLDEAPSAEFLSNNHNMYRTAEEVLLGRWESAGYLVKRGRRRQGLVYRDVSDIMATMAA